MEIATRRRARPRTAAPILAVAVALAALGAATDARSGQVKGKLSGGQLLMNPVWQEAKEASANRFTWREPSPTVRADFRQLFAHLPKEVCIAALAPSPVTSTATIALKLSGGRTSPVTLVVAPGATIEFQNRDPFPHKPFVVGQASFTVSEMKSGSTRQWKVPGPGKYEVRDELAPSMRSFIVVEPHVAAIGFPARDGSFTLHNVPPGEYRLQAFFNGEATGKTVQALVKGDGVTDVKEELVVAEPEKKEPPKDPKDPKAAKGAKK